MGSRNLSCFPLDARNDARKAGEWEGIMNTIRIKRELLQLVDSMDLLERQEWREIVLRQVEDVETGVVAEWQLESLYDVVEELVTR